MPVRKCRRHSKLRKAPAESVWMNERMNDDEQTRAVVRRPLPDAISSFLSILLLMHFVVKDRNWKQQRQPFQRSSPRASPVSINPEQWWDYTNVSDEKVSHSTLDEICKRVSIARLSRWVTGPLRCQSSATLSLSLGTRGRRRETPPTIFNFHLGCRADTMATEGWRPGVSGCCRYPSMPRELMTTTGRRGGARAMETEDESRAKYSSCQRTNERAGTGTKAKCKLV